MRKRGCRHPVIDKNLLWVDGIIFKVWQRIVVTRYAYNTIHTICSLLVSLALDMREIAYTPGYGPAQSGQRTLQNNRKATGFAISHSSFTVVAANHHLRMLSTSWHQLCKAVPLVLGHNSPQSQAWTLLQGTIGKRQ